MVSSIAQMIPLFMMQEMLSSIAQLISLIIIQEMLRSVTKKYYTDLRSFGPNNIFLVTDRSIYCHMTLSVMNYLLYRKYFQYFMFHMVQLRTHHCLKYVNTIQQFNRWRGVLDTTLCDQVCQWLATGRWVSPGTPVSSTNKTDRHDIIVIKLKVALSTQWI
jgi:hypothetical protein